MENSSQEEICKRIARVRLEVAGPRGKAAFAKRLGISPSTYDYYESARVPPADILVRISEIGQVDLRWLLTGEASAEPIRGDNPILHRVAQLLARSPQSTAPLSAFLDILAQTMKFPDKTPQAQPGSEQAAPPPTQGDPGSPSAQLSAPQAGAAPSVQDAQAATETPPPSPEGSPGQPALPPEEAWIPILGRSAAGIPQFWSDTDSQAGLTLLADVMARQSAWPAGLSQPAEALGETGRDPVQVIVLRCPQEGQTAEYVSAPAVKARYRDAFALRIDGDSMSPDIRHGDLVILSPSAQAADGRPAVVQLRRQIGVTCKLYRRQGDRVHLVPLNENLHPQEFPLADVEWALRVLARVRLSQ